MIKKLLMLMISLFCVQTAHPDTTNTLINIAEVISTIKKTQTISEHEKYKRMIQENFDQLAKPFDQPAVNGEIKGTRERINTAASKLLELAASNKSNININDFAKNLLQPCYQLIIQNSMYPSIFSKQQQLQINTFSIAPHEEKKAEFQIYDILNRIFVLWHLTKVIFQVPSDHKIKLEWPSAELSIDQWIKLTQDAANKLWASLEPAVQMAAHAQEEEQKQMLAAKKIHAAQKEKFENLVPAAEQSDQFKKIMDLFIKYISSQKLNHAIFTKYEFNENVGLAIVYLKMMEQKLINEDKLPEDALLEEIKFLQYQFAQQINKIYSHYFKKDLGGHFGDKFLVIKHKFAAQPHGEPIANLEELEAVELLTDLIVLLEMYETLFSESNINLPYFNTTRPVQKWIEQTAHAGFKEPAEFSEKLKKSVSECLPAEPEKINKLSLAAQNIKAGVTLAGSAIKDKAKKTGATIKESAQATRGWLSSTWHSFKNYITRDITEELDEL